MCVCSYTCIGGPFGYFIGFFYLPLFSTLIPRSVRKKVRSLRRLLLIGTSNSERKVLSSLSGYLQPANQQHNTAAAWGAATTTPSWGSGIYIHTLPTDFGVQRAEPRPCQSMRPIIVSCYGRSEAAPYPTPGIKTNIFP